MKTLLLLLTLIVSVNLSAQSDTLNGRYTIFYPNNANTILIYDGYIPYIVGSNEIPGYEIETRVCEDDTTVTLSNGRRIAGLSCIIFEKIEYIGGSMMFKGDTTVVTDIQIVPIGDEAEFTVVGEDFSMSFTLKTGIILKYENDFAVFNTEDRGIWTIRKKA
jgi:hypothetical protein